MIVIGLTGGIGTGKSTVAAMCRRLGAVVLDADAIAREVVEPKRLAWRQIVKVFGEEVLNDDQTINRRRLAERVFADAEGRQQLEAIVHPPVLRRVKAEVRRLARARRTNAVVLDVPLLLETGAHGMVDVVVVVTAPPEVQRQRLRRKYGWSDEEISSRVGAQWDLSAKVALADEIIDNSDGVETTRTQVKRLWTNLVERSNK